MSNVYVCLCLQSTYCLCLCLCICLIYADKLGKSWIRVALFQFSGTFNKFCDVIQFSLNSFSIFFSSPPPPLSYGEETERQDIILIKLNQTEFKSLSFPPNINSSKKIFRNSNLLFSYYIKTSFKCKSIFNIFNKSYFEIFHILNEFTLRS